MLAIPICSVIIVTLATVTAYPADPDEQQQMAKKADVFMSRGWGAGGMPFNVLYTQQPKLSRGVPQPPAAMPIVDLASYYTEPQALRTVRHDPVPAMAVKYNPARKQYSVIPQLFVSYGWGPLGKK